MKNLFLIVALVLFTFNLNAQDEEKSSGNSDGISFGVVAGVNFATLTGDDDDNLSSLTGLHFGVEADIPLSEKLSFQSGLIYGCFGAEYGDSEEGSILYDGKFKLGYLYLPLTLAVEVADGLSLEAGPQIGILTSAKDEYESPGDSGEEDIKDELKGIDFGVGFGLGYRLENGLNFGARYNVGLTNINDTDADWDLKNSAFQISVGYFFN